MKIAVTMIGFGRMLTIALARSSTTDGEVGLRAAARKAWRTSPITIAWRGSLWPATSADREGDAPVRQRERIVPIAADDRFFGGWNVGGIELHRRCARGAFPGSKSACASQRIGNVVLARVDLGAVDRDGDADRQLFEEFAVEVVQLARAEIVDDAQGADRAFARLASERKGEVTTVIGGGGARRIRDRLHAELVQHLRQNPPPAPERSSLGKRA